MQETYFTDLLRKPLWMLFLFSWLFYLIGLFLFSQFVWDDNTYMLDFTGTSFEGYISGIRKIDLLRYILSPVWIVGITAIIWILIKSGLIIMQIEIKAVFLFKIILLGLVFLSLPFWIKTIGLIVVKGDYNPDEIKNFFPGSIISFLNISSMKEIEINALAHINLYHLCFMLFVSWQVSVYSILTMARSCVLLLLTYGLGIFLLRCLIFVILT